jgi:hypothetical protein
MRTYGVNVSEGHWCPWLTLIPTCTTYIYGPLQYSVRVYDQYLHVCQLLIDISGIYIHIYIPMLFQLTIHLYKCGRENAVLFAYNTYITSTVNWHTLLEEPSGIPALVTHDAGRYSVGSGQIHHPLVAILRHELPRPEFSNCWHGLVNRAPNWIFSSPVSYKILDRIP